MIADQPLILHTVVERMRSEVQIQRDLIQRQRDTLAQQTTKIHGQEALILEQQAQLQAQASELRALRRQHTYDQEFVRQAAALSEPPYVRERRARAEKRGPPEKKRSASFDLNSSHSPRTPSTRQLLEQALHDKVVLVKQLQRLVNEVAQARASAKQAAIVSERSLAAAWRLGELGQAGMALVTEMEDGRQTDGKGTDDRRHTLG
jgi:hypothetical protein